VRYWVASSATRAYRGGAKLLLCLTINLTCFKIISFVGGGFRNWKKRWCVLKEESLSYYVKQGDTKPKKTIDLKEARGVRTKDQCSLENWPGDATFCFGLATSKRTWFFYGSDGKAVK